MKRQEIIFTGTHGTGKTSLAEQIAKTCKIPFFPSQASEVHKILGIDPAAAIDFRTRLTVQVAIFNAWSEQYQLAKSLDQGFVFDRCPLDFAGYLLADVPRDLDGPTSALVMDYTNQCIESSKQLGIIFLVEPHGQAVADRALKASGTNEAYAALVQHVINSMLLKNMARFFRIGAGTVDTRITQVSQCLSSDFAAKAKEEIEARRSECQLRPLNA